MSPISPRGALIVLACCTIFFTETLCMPKHRASTTAKVYTEPSPSTAIFPAVSSSPLPSSILPSNSKTLNTDGVKVVTQLCGSRGMAACPSDMHCITNTLKTNIELVADYPGSCVALDGPECNASIPCPNTNQVCADDPRDECIPHIPDPLAGIVGRDPECPGVCVVF